MSMKFISIRSIDKHVNLWTYTGSTWCTSVLPLRYIGAQVHVYKVFRAQEPKAPVTYCDHALSVVRPSVRLFTFSTSSPEPLDGFWWNFVWMKYSRSLTSAVVLPPDPPRGGSRAGQNSSWGSPSSERKATASNRMHSSDLEAFGKKCCYFWFHSEVKFLTRFWRLFGLSHFGVF